MEVVEGLKEGYESNVDQDEGLGDNSEYEEEDEEEESEEERNYSDSDRLGGLSKCKRPIVEIKRYKVFVMCNRNIYM